MKQFKKWDKKYIEDWGTICSDDYKSYCRAFKNFLKRNLPDCEIIGFKANHYDVSGFVKKGDKFIYIAQNMDRLNCQHDFNAIGCANGVLFRTAKNEKDYRGGSNHFSSMYDLIDNINMMFESERWWKEVA